MAGRLSARTKILAGVAIVVAVVAGFHRAGLAHLRSAESQYMAGRALTACASRQLRPFADEARPIDELPEAVLEIVTEARDEARRTLASAGDAGAVPYPGVRRAAVAVREALEAEVALYDAMVDDPTNSDDELEALGAANRAAESRLATARRFLFVGEAPGWDDRNRCPSR
ncbi:MAG TPA: hypothetical protein VM345_14425 [Acidimicrobiales bacterium]|nr:hypothetical protein [Acidimicrobiales bacterium]